MSVSRLMQMAAAGAGNHPAPPPIAIEDYFSTYLYTGNGSTQTITNGIDLAGEGGLVWLKWRSGVGISSSSHLLFDTERGATKALLSDQTLAELTDSSWLTSFSPSGFSVGNSGSVNDTNNSYASWTFRKAPRFFDVVTWTGDGTSERVISHSLGVTPGAVIIKATSTTGDWWFTHRLVGTDNGSDLSMRLNATGAAATFGIRASTDSSTTFTLRGANNVVYANSSGATYVAYLFAHDPLGPSGDGSDGLIACGSFDVVSGTATVDLGWEPQWLLVKASSTSSGWWMMDNMRGHVASPGTDTKYFRANEANAEASWGLVNGPTATGFQFNTANLGTHIYIAIRRGPMRQPTSGTEVFAPVTFTGNDLTRVLPSGFPVDAFLLRRRDTTDNFSYLFNRLAGSKNGLLTTAANVEASNSNWPEVDLQDGVRLKEVFFNTSGESRLIHMFRRAPGFFDVVAYTGDGVAGRTVPHNLGVAPEMMIVKPRSGFVRGWTVYLGPLSTSTNDVYAMLNETSAAVDAPVFNDTAPTDTVFTVSADAQVNNGTSTYIAYLFATLPGVSKVGSYTGNGSSQTIDCGFTTGARFVLIKRTDSTGDWYVWDTARGIVTGNDPHLSLNTTAAEVTTNDSVDPEATGFIVNQDAATNINVNAASYIFLAIA